MLSICTHREYDSDHAWVVMWRPFMTLSEMVCQIPLSEMCFNDTVLPHGFYIVAAEEQLRNGTIQMILKFMVFMNKAYFQ
jgi:hypothetical protein